MQIASLNSDEFGPGDITTDVCIIGAGAAGLYLARRLADSHVSITVVEAGPQTPVDGRTAGFACEFSNAVYRGATEGRSFGLGGTTSRWGGQLVASPAADGIRADDVFRDAWRHIHQVGEQYRHAVASLLGVDEELHTPERALGAPPSPPGTSDLALGMSCALPFRRRNFQWMTRGTEAGDQDSRVFCDAVAAEWHLDQGTNGACRVRELAVRSPSAHTLRIRAKHYVVAAGTIESTRILHEINETGDDRVLPPQAALGRNLSDHLSFEVAEFAAASRVAAARLFAPRFLHGVMQSWRLLEAAPNPHEPRYFAHIIFPTENPGFRLARAMLQALQARRAPAVSARDLASGSVGMVRLAWSRFARSRLYIDVNAPCHMQLDIEQQPDVRNAVTLGRERDRFGRRVAKIDWAVRAEDEANMARARSRFLSHWTAFQPSLQLCVSSGADEPTVKPYDAYHPVGTCRIGDDASAVADPSLRVRGTENVYVLSTAIFPSAGSANPTFNLLCYAERLADRLAREDA